MSLGNDNLKDRGGWQADSRAFEAILATITDTAYVLDLQGRFQFINQPLLNLWGLTFEQARGKNFRELNYPEELAERLGREIAQVISTRSVFVGTMQYVSPAGIAGHYQYTLSPVLAANGVVEAVAGSMRDISEQKGVDQRARTILESITDGFFALDKQWKFNYVNPLAEKILGRLPGDLLGTVIWDAYPGLQGTLFEKTYHKAMTQKMPGSFTSFYPDHNRWYEVHAYPSSDGIAIYFRDVSERKQTELAASDIALKFGQQSRLFEQIASSTPDFIYVFDLHGKVLYANRRLLEVWGTTYENALGKGLDELGYPAWHVEMHLNELREVIETRKPIKGEIPFTGGSGISGVYEYIFNPVLGADGHVEVIAGTTRDVTERRNFEQQLARDRMLLANVQDSVIVVDLNGVVTFWNQGATRLFGWTAQEMLNRPYADRFPEPEREKVAHWVGQLLAGEDTPAGEWLDYRKDGTRVWIEGTTRHISDPTLDSLGIMGVCRDISERKHAEAEREQLLASERAARGDAERASRMKDEFLATLSHELRTPLNAILGWAIILKSTDSDKEEMIEGISVIERNARAQTQIIEDLLDMSRIISGKVRLDVQQIELADAVMAAIDTVRPAATTKGVRLQAVLDPLAHPVSGDLSRLQQVFWNLLSNAVKFTPKEGRVHVRLERVNSHVEVSVTDTGEGISPEFLPFVFDRFRQADASTTRRHGGLGLGLSIVKQLIELHGGSVSVKSLGSGKGSTFSVALPLTVLHPEPETTAPRRHPELGIAPARPDDCGEVAGAKVLVVDDEPDARELVKRLLEGCAAVVVTAGSAAEAFEKFRHASFDVLVTDIGMPQEDGYSLIRKVRALSSESGGATPAIALTAYARSEDRVKSFGAGFQMHLAKPVEPAELIAMVANLARKK